MCVQHRSIQISEPVFDKFNGCQTQINRDMLCGCCAPESGLVLVEDSLSDRIIEEGSGGKRTALSTAEEP